MIVCRTAGCSNQAIEFSLQGGVLVWPPAPSTPTAADRHLGREQPEAMPPRWGPGGRSPRAASPGRPRGRAISARLRAPAMADPLASGPPRAHLRAPRRAPEPEPAGAPRSEASFGAARPSGLLDRLSRVDTPGMRILYRLFWPGIWLVFLAYPISDILGGRWNPGRTALAWALLTLFAALYLTSMWLATGFRSEPERPVRLLPYAAFVALTIGLVLGFGADFGGLMIYAGVVMAGPSAPAATAGVPPPGRLPDALMTVALGVTVILTRAVVWLMIERRRAREEIADLAAAKERLRFSRDLHDVLGHSLSVIALKSQVARRLIERDPTAARTSLAELERWLTNRSPRCARWSPGTDNGRSPRSCGTPTRS